MSTRPPSLSQPKRPPTLAEEMRETFFPNMYGLDDTPTPSSEHMKNLEDKFARLAQNRGISLKRALTKTKHFLATALELSKQHDAIAVFQSEEEALETRCFAAQLASLVTAKSAYLVNKGKRGYIDLATESLDQFYNVLRSMAWLPAWMLTANQEKTPEQVQLAAHYRQDLIADVVCAEFFALRSLSAPEVSSSSSLSASFINDCRLLLSVDTHCTIFLNVMSFMAREAATDPHLNKLILDIFQTCMTDPQLMNPIKAIIALDTCPPYAKSGSELKGVIEDVYTFLCKQVLTAYDDIAPLIASMYTSTVTGLCRQLGEDSSLYKTAVQCLNERLSALEMHQDFVNTPPVPRAPPALFTKQAMCGRERPEFDDPAEQRKAAARRLCGHRDPDAEEDAARRAAARAHCGTLSLEDIAYMRPAGAFVPRTPDGFPLQ